MTIDTPALDRKWHVIYVITRHEKKVFEELVKREIEAYLPMRKELHDWSDRKKWVEVPLFPSYVFVKACSSEYESIYNVKSFLKFVTFNGRPCVVPEWQIDGVRNIIKCYPTDVEVLEGSYRGMWAEITSGPLTGLQGEIIELVNGKTFIIRIEGIDKIIGVRVPVGGVRVLGTAGQFVCG
ncbi:MAG: UpxY family transcription antiterminator [Candidatus Kryptoniota bacterium]